MRRLFVWMLAALLLLAACSPAAAEEDTAPPGEEQTNTAQSQDTPEPQPPDGSDAQPSIEEVYNALEQDPPDDQWAPAADSGVLLGFLAEDQDPASAADEQLLESMEVRLLRLTADAPAVREAAVAVAAAAPSTAGEAAGLYAKSYFELIQPRAAALAGQYIWGTAMPHDEQFQREYAGEEDARPATFLDTRIKRLEAGGVFSRDGVRYLVYTLEYEYLPEQAGALVCAGEMGVGEDGWLDLGLSDLLALRLEEDGSLSLAFGEMSDIFPDNEEFFPEEFGRILARYTAYGPSLMPAS